MNKITIALTFLCVAVAAALFVVGLFVPVAVLLLVALFVATSLRLANPWECYIVVRAGKKAHTKGPGLFILLPFIDSVVNVIDTRIQTTMIEMTEQTLTADKTPVRVDCVIFWSVVDPQRAATEVVNYKEAVELVSLTSLRTVIGKSDINKMVGDQEALDKELQAIIDLKTNDWGVAINKVELRDVELPEALQDAMSKQAQATQETAARVTLAGASVAVAEKMEEASAIYTRTPVALELLRIDRMVEMAASGNMTLLMVPTSMPGAMDGAALSLALKNMPAPVAEIPAPALPAPEPVSA